MSRTRVIGAVVALVLCAALPVAQLATAGSVTAICCCGPHDGEHQCGCDDCPALRGERGPESPEPGMSSCDMRGDWPTLPWAPAAVVPAPAIAFTLPARRWSFPIDPVHAPTRTLRPPCPDG